MDVSLTLFKSVYDNKTHRTMDFSSFDEFENLLYKLAEKKVRSKKDAQLISPAKYTGGTTRANKNVLSWAGWAAVDVDDHEFEGNLKSELYDRFGKYRYVCYSTASSTSDLPKFRIVFPLDVHVESSSIKHFWHSLNTEIGRLGDTQTKDLSRMYYIPANYAGAYNFIFSNHDGDAINPFTLMNKYPYEEKKNSHNFIDRLPENIQKQIIEYKRSQLENNNVIWSGYRDCPFVNKRLVQEYVSISSIDGSGRYAMIYKIMSSIAINAIKNKYPITAFEIESLIRELDADTSKIYENRNLNMEADRAIEYAYKAV